LGVEAVEIAKMLLSAPEVDIGGQPLAILTGKLTLLIELKDRKERVTFNIYNDRFMMIEGSTLCRFVPESFVKSTLR
jgi:hypothetical protein